MGKAERKGKKTEARQCKLWCLEPRCVYKVTTVSQYSSTVKQRGFLSTRYYTNTMLSDPVFSCFAFYSTLLILKMYIIAFITGQVRLRKKAFANPEDAARHGGDRFCRTDPDVERCRRAHLNDMENIFPFLFLGSIYSFTQPSLAAARGHFLVFFVARIVHTIAYLLALKAPTRSLAYTIAQVPCVSMVIQILIAMASYA